MGVSSQGKGVAGEKGRVVHQVGRVGKNQEVERVVMGKGLEEEGKEVAEEGWGEGEGDASGRGGGGE